MGGKSATSTQSVAIPPSVLAQYNSVNANAEQVAATPFQQYGGQFVAPVNAEQSAGIANTNTAANEAQPYYSAATAGLGAAQSAVNPVNAAAEAGTAASSSPLTGQQIDSYLSPYLNEVLGSTGALLNQNNQQQQAGQLGNAITSGAFGGDRTGIAAANLEQQQNLANANIYSGIANQGYQSALSTAQGQQQIGLAGSKQLADIGSTAYGEGANTASELASLGTGAQTAGLQGAQSQIAAGTVQQQTQQAQDTAEYQQFLQQQSYPFQTAQFLANIAEGTGALSGSTTTTTQPGGFFSDERLKEDMEPIGKTFDGQPIYRYKMKGDSRERIGLSAQEVEKKHPDAVGLAGGYRYVDYGKATEAAANRSHFYEGGVVPFRRQRFADGGDAGGGLDAVLQAQRNMYSPQQGGGGQRNIPSTGASHQLAVAQGTPAPPASGSSKVSQTIGLGKDAYQGYKYFNKPTAAGAHPASTGLSPAGVQPSGATTYGAGPTSTSSAGLSPAGAQSSGAVSYGAGAPEEATSVSPLTSELPANTAGLGAADTGAAGAATDAAASGATGAAAEGAAGAGAEAAAGAGAGAAAGAAGGAAAGAAADAAATEAAALAAEYAASYAAIAAVAAKRGGRIKNRSGLAAGGNVDPYSDPDGGLVIPDQENGNEHLQSPGALVKHPSGFSSLMKGGEPDQAMNNTGEIFSNQALARGGLAGRHRYDDGGGVPDDSPDAGLSSAPAAASAADDTSAPTGVAPKGKHWWEKSENILPILSGLAAMGTTKTRSPGVALAAGLGAGADSYLSTRRSQAGTEEIQAKAKGLDISNQLGAMKIKAAKDYLDPSTTPVNPYAPAVESSATAPSGPDKSAQATADGVEQMYQKKYGVAPWTPDEQATMKKARGAAIALGTDQPVVDAQARRDQRFQNETYAKQQAAQVEADQLRDQYLDPKSTQPQRAAALVRYNAIHQRTGDTPAIEGGIVKNSRTGVPEIGTIAQQGFTPTDEAGVMEKVMHPMDVPNSDGTTTQMPWWQANHFPSPLAAKRAIMVNSTASSSSAVSASAAPSRPVVAPAAAPSGATPPVVTQGTTQSPVAARQQGLDQEAVSHVREAGDQAPNNRNINQQLLQLSAATATGPATAAVQKIAGALGLRSGSRYQEINAYLDRQAASQALAMGVPHTNAGLAASQTATGTTEYTPAALQEKVKYADALNSGTMAYREGLDKAVGTGGTPNLSKYQPFRSAWAKNFDPDIYRVEDAQRRGDAAELNSLRERLGSRGMKVLAQKSANLRALENGQIPP